MRCGTAISRPNPRPQLAVGGRLTAGSATARPIDAGQAIRIFTGAPMPAGADTVFMQEDVRAEGDAVIVPAGLKAGANRRLAGEDVRKGSVVLPAGRRLAAQDVALAAAVGLTTARCAAPRARRAVLDRRRDRRARQAAPRRGALRRQPHPARRHARSPRRECHRPRHSQGRCRRAGESDCGCGPRPRPGADLRAASRPAKPIMCEALWKRSAAWCSGASPSSPAGRWRWA